MMMLIWFGCFFLVFFSFFPPFKITKGKKGGGVREIYIMSRVFLWLFSFSLSLSFPLSPLFLSIGHFGNRERKKSKRHETSDEEGKEKIK